MQRHDLIPAPIEMVDGKLLWSEADRLVLLAALLENVGALKAVELGDPDVWRAAVDRLVPRGARGGSDGSPDNTY